MNYLIIRPEEYVMMPWKNGRGRTTELYAQKDPSTEKNIFRVSIAGVTEDGPFSSFPGYDRTLLILEGGGLKLKHSDGSEQTLRTPDDIAAFSGDLITHANLIEGAVKDFNVMCQKERCRAGVSIFQDSGSCCDPGLKFIYAVTDVKLTGAFGCVPVPAGCSFLLQNGNVSLVSGRAVAVKAVFIS